MGSTFPWVRLLPRFLSLDRILSLSDHERTMIPDPPGSEIVTPSSEPIDNGKPSAVPKAWRRLPLPVRRALMSGGAAVGAVALVYAALAGNTPQRHTSPRAATPKPASVVKLAAS